MWIKRTGSISYICMLTGTGGENNNDYGFKVSSGTHTYWNCFCKWNLKILDKRLGQMRCVLLPCFCRLFINFFRWNKKIMCCCCWCCFEADNKMIQTNKNKLNEYMPVELPVSLQPTVFDTYFFWPNILNWIYRLLIDLYYCYFLCNNFTLHIFAIIRDSILLGTSRVTFCNSMSIHRH